MNEIFFVLFSGGCVSYGLAAVMLSRLLSVHAMSCVACSIGLQTLLYSRNQPYFIDFTCCCMNLTANILLANIRSTSTL